MSHRILITGATGLIGKKLIAKLLQKGHQVHVYSRKKQYLKGAKVFVWDVESKVADLEAFEAVETIIHLAGAGIADKRWTEKRKNEIVDSRIESANFLYQLIRDNKFPIKTFISASAVGFYGNRGEELLTEKSPAGTDFLATCCQQWENAAAQGNEMGIRTVCIRIGVILSAQGGALPSLEKPIRYFLGAPLGAGKQWVPWIHIDDISGIFAIAVDNNAMQGAYNACSPLPVTNKTLTKTVAKAMHRPIWPFSIPTAVLKMALGEMAAVILNSNNTVAQKILDAGYHFKYINLADALADIYHDQ